MWEADWQRKWTAALVKPTGSIVAIHLFPFIISKFLGYRDISSMLLYSAKIDTETAQQVFVE